MSTSEPTWLSLEDVLRIQRSIIDQIGGAHGVRDSSLLESAINKPLNSFFYASTEDIHLLAASYAEGIARNHGFIDGNKRTALIAADLFLQQNGFKLAPAKGDELANLMERLAQGTASAEEFAEHLRKNSTPLSRSAQFSASQHILSTPVTSLPPPAPGQPPLHQPHLSHARPPTLAQAGRADARLAGVMAVGGGAYAAASALYQGSSVVQATAQGAVAAAHSAPVLGPLLQGRYAEASAQLVTFGLAVGAALTTIVSGGTSWAGAAALEEGLRRSLRAKGADVDDSLITAMAKSFGQAVERTIPAGVMQADTRIRTTQENLLKDVGLGDKDKKGRTAADYLREPQTRDAYLGALKDALAKETNPKAREHIANMVEASEKFLEIEGRRIARLQPYMKEIEDKLAATLKVLHLATKFKEENSTPTIASASSMAASNTPRSNGTAASRV